ncbi:ribonuclease E/G [Cellulomonas sp. SG140]|uniref:ribonuclease E/G n=1 Tax=Cellulomonas sp. SG140 TaxID=2976536 RepID=UPI0021E7613B|nr:ribonuclease E/G [Cellulomonas sp. SG140]
MTEQTTPEPVDGQAGGGETVRPRRRRATRSVAAPTPVTTPTAAGAEQEVPVAATAVPADAAPTAEAAAIPSGTASVPASDLPAEPSAAPRRRRAVRRTAAAGAPEAAAEPSAPDVEAPVAPEAEEVPAGRRRSSRRPAGGRARSAAPDEAAEVEPVQTAGPETVAEELEEDSQAAPTAAEPAVTTPAAPSTASYEAPQPPRLATTALLFQAPDLAATRQRRRRAQVGAGSPEEISEAARRAERADAAVAEIETAAEAPAAEEGQQGGRSRRRRGRGRGEQTPELAVVDEAVGVVELEGVGDEALDVSEDDLDTEAPEDEQGAPRRRRRRGGRGRRSRSEVGEPLAGATDEPSEDEEEPAAEVGEEDGAEDEQGASSRRRRRRRRGARTDSAESEPRSRTRSDEVTALRGSTRLEAKRQRRREGRDAGRRRQIISEAEFLARRESVDRAMVVREANGRTQIAVLEDGVLVEHYVSNQAQASMVGNVYLGRVQNVLPSMEAAFVDVGKGRNAVLYAGEVNWDAAGLEGQPRRIEQALKSGDAVLVQVTKDPIGHKGARLTSQVTLAGRYLVYVPGGGMTGISRKLPDNERARLKKILRDIVPDSAGVIVRTAAEGASEEELRADIARLRGQWEAIEKKSASASAPALLQGEPDMAIRVVRDIFNDDFSSLVVQGDDAWSTISGYIGELAPDLAAKVSRWTGTGDVFAAHRVDEQLAKGMDRKVWLPSGGSLVIDRTEAMTVIDVNTGKFTGAGGTLEETVTRNNLEAAEEIVRQLRLRDIGGIIVVDFIDMVLESNRDLVLRRLVECLGRDRTKHQVAEVTSLGLVQMTRKRVGQGLVEAFSETCEHCHGRGFIVHTDPIERNVRPDAGQQQPAPSEGTAKRSRRKRGAGEPVATPAVPVVPVLPEAREAVKATLATIAAAAAHAHEHAPQEGHPGAEGVPAVPEMPASDEPSSAPVEVAVVEAGDVEPAATPVLDVFAELAARGVTTDPQPPSGTSVVAEPTAGTEQGDAEALALTPVAPEVFAADGQTDAHTEAETGAETGADTGADTGPEQV